MLLAGKPCLPAMLLALSPSLQAVLLGCCQVRPGMLMGVEDKLLQQQISKDDASNLLRWHTITPHTA